ncbi:unnamed protein product [Protopolystoma xenopodis]|uniref:Cadherin domain-containing protein n=1 Tax=Protopolystoma xenopodis TaxID=117903 RepID=A0A3S5AEQ1_9PLAT|nr:unnamed protein product [Protopolystoma xenopodis]
MITVLVQDLNDNPPVFISPGRDHLSRPILDTAGTNIASFGANKPNILQPTTFDGLGISGYHLVIPEDLPEGAYLTTLQATDRDSGRNSRITYTLFSRQEDKRCFHVNQRTGVVRLAAGCYAWRRELPQPRGIGWVHHLTATARDGSSTLLVQTQFTVQVLPVHINVFPPRFSHQPAIYSGWIAENKVENSPVFRIDIDSWQESQVYSREDQQLFINATDPEGDPLFLTIVGGTGFGRFRIDSDGKQYSFYIHSS